MKDFKYFSYVEFEASATAREHGINNRIPNITVKKNIAFLVNEILDPLSELVVMMPIYVMSGYRCKELNTVLKGRKNSQHMKGEAADITTYDKYGNMVMVIELLCGHTASEARPDGPMLFDDFVEFFDFDQLIIHRMTGDKTNFAWLHVSYKCIGKNRREVKICDGVKKEEIILDIEAQYRLVRDLAEQVTLHDNALKEKYKPSKLKLQ